jgi:hypothetical protein
MDAFDLTPENQRLAFGLGLSGLLPFVGLAIAAWWVSPAWVGWVIRAQILYGASILAFLGGLHWGFALAGRLSAQTTRAALGWSVVPSLIACGAAGMPDRLGLFGLAGGLTLAWAVDQRAWRYYGVGGWFLRLRSLLTVVATISLLATALLADRV